MNELLQGYLGKNCLIYAYDDITGVEGRISAINGQWLEVETKKGKKLLNADFILRIEEKPEKKK